MSKDRKEVISQLSFDLEAGRNPNKGHNGPAIQENVIHFVDSATLAIRREAIRRVEISGIFNLRKQK